MLPATSPCTRTAPTAVVVHGLAGQAEPPLGAHLVTPRFAYVHHGIYVGNGRVVHYGGLKRLLTLRGPVEEVTLEHFADGRPVSIKHRPLPRFAPDEIVSRARARLGEDRYRLTTNNCEHFCEWVLSGEHRSEQVERYVRVVRVVVRGFVRAFVRRLRQPAEPKLDTLPGVSG